MKDWGTILVVAGALMTVLVGFSFYAYFQQLLAASAASASGSSASLTNALGIYNGTANMPILITIAIFGFAFLIIGGIFYAVGNASELLLEQREDSRSVGSEAVVARPSRACVKCGTLLYQSTGYCPNCGNPLPTSQLTVQSATSPQRG